MADQSPHTEQWPHDPVLTFCENVLPLVQSGRAIFFCGAGISIHSGLPMARQLLQEVVRHLPLSQAAAALMSSPFPFESFMEVLRRRTRIDALLDIFRHGEPCSTHHLLAKLAALGQLPVICTTNFDPLIECALETEGLRRSADYEVYADAHELSRIDWNDGRVKVVKLHGSIEKPASVILTLNQVSSGLIRPSLREVIRFLFSDGDHEAVIILGYSCSDVFDILPAIRSVKSITKSVFIVEHTPDVMAPLSGSTLEPINAGESDSPFMTARRGLRAKLDTDQLVRRLWVLCLQTQFEWLVAPPVWKHQVKLWANSWESESPACGFQVAGELLEAVGSFQEAIHLLDLGGKIAYSRGEQERGAMLLSALGRVNNSIGLYDKALEYHEAALAAAEKLQSDVGRGGQLTNIGNVLHNLSRYEEAIQCHKSALRIARRIGQEQLECKSAGNLGISYKALGEYQRALRYHKRAIKLACKIGDKMSEARNLANLSLSYRHLGRLNEAMKSIQGALAIARQLGDRKGEGLYLGNLGNVFASLGNKSAALQQHEEALAIAREVGDRVNEANQLGNLAVVLKDAGDFEEAMNAANVALKFAGEIGHLHGKALYCTTIAEIHLGQGSYYSGVRFANKAVRILEDILGTDHQDSKYARSILATCRSALRNSRSQPSSARGG